MDLAGIVGGAITIVGGALRSAGVRVELAIPEGLPQVRGSVVALERVLVNLMVNARDAMEEKPEAERRIEITCQRTADDYEVVLTLRDHGTGISTKVLERAFEPFFTTKPVGKGTDLGLSIAYGTIAASAAASYLRNHPEGGALAESGCRWRTGKYGKRIAIDPGADSGGESPRGKTPDMVESHRQFPSAASNLLWEFEGRILEQRWELDQPSLRAGRPVDGCE